MRTALRPEAQRDLDAIRDYSRKKWGAEQARKYISGIKDRIREAGRNPLRYAPTPERPDGMRRIRSGSHVILFIARPERTEIIRILHERMDFDARLD